MTAALLVGVMQSCGDGSAVGGCDALSCGDGSAVGGCVSLPLSRG